MCGYFANFNFHYKSNHKISHKLYFEITTFSIYIRIIYRKNKMIFIMETNNLNDSYTTSTDGTAKETRTNDFEFKTDGDQLKNVKFGNYGWICPVCGCGCSPYTTVCPHCSGNRQYNEPWKITCEDLRSNGTYQKIPETSHTFTTTCSVSGNAPKFENPLFS